MADFSNYKKIRISIYNITPGMIAAGDIHTKEGQLLVSEGSPLTEEIIEKLKTFSVPFIPIFARNKTEEDKNVSETIDLSNNTPRTYSENIKSTAQFQKFQSEFNKSINDVNQSLQHIVNNSADIDISKLLHQTTSLLECADSNIGILEMLANLRTYDDSTYAHSLNVSLICRIFGQWLHLPEQDLDILTVAGILHDLGKLMIPPEVIKKPGRLTPNEYSIIKQHPILGYNKLKQTRIDPRIKYATLMHHEKADGSGYPYGLKLHEIDTFARIVTIADVYDAMTANRVYRDGLCPFHVISQFEEEGFQKYDVQFLLPFLSGIVQTYLHNHIALNDGRTGQIIMINSQALSRPLVQLSDGFVDLSKEPNLYIQKVL